MKNSFIQAGILPGLIFLGACSQDISREDKTPGTAAQSQTMITSEFKSLDPASCSIMDQNGVRHIEMTIRKLNEQSGGHYGLALNGGKYEAIIPAKPPTTVNASILHQFEYYQKVFDGYQQSSFFLGLCSPKALRSSMEEYGKIIDAYRREVQKLDPPRAPRTRESHVLDLRMA